MKYTRLYPCIIVLTLYANLSHGGSLSAIQAHNTFVDNLHASINSKELCSRVLETYSPLNLQLAAAYEYYNYITNELSKSTTQRLDSGVSHGNVWENLYADFSKIISSHDMNGHNKFRQLCESEKSTLFSRDGLKNFVNTNKITLHDEEKTILEGTLTNNNKIFYHWSKSDGKWRFNRATNTSQIKYPAINNSKRIMIVDALATHHKIDIMFEKCIGISNSIFNSNDVKLLLQQAYGIQLISFFKDNKHAIKLAKDREAAKVADILRQSPDSCATKKDKARVLSAALNQIGANIRNISMLPLRE